MSDEKYSVAYRQCVFDWRGSGDDLHCRYEAAAFQFQLIWSWKSTRGLPSLNWSHQILQRRGGKYPGKLILLGQRPCYHCFWEKGWFLCIGSKGKHAALFTCRTYISCFATNQNTCSVFRSCCELFPLKPAHSVFMFHSWFFFPVNTVFSCLTCE